MKKVLLLILDGWGHTSKRKGNAILKAHPKHFLHLQKKYPSTKLHASGKHVGLLPGYMGNSEVGHVHLGAGRLEQQDLARIVGEIKNGKFFRNKVLMKAMKKAGKKPLHLLGLVSDGGVHSHMKHLFGLLDMAKKFNVEQVYVHAITDGRDVSPTSALKYISQLERRMSKLNKNWKIATVIGRYYAMDRDNRWNREHKAYSAIVEDEGYQCKSATEAIQKAYSRGETDEFIRPTNIVHGGQSYNVKPGEVVIFFNFRSDRARQLTKAFVQGRFNKFKRKKLINLHFVCLTEFEHTIKTPVAYPPKYLKNTLGEVIARKNLRQFHLAETEKYAHVTYFFNGLAGKVFKNEERLLIPSPKVTTYDKCPQMSVYKITKKAEELIKKGKHEFILINFANADMVGHTGVFKKAIESIKHTDACLKRVADLCIKHDTALIITADHGNAEEMLYPDGSVCTAHSTNKVPFVLVDSVEHSIKKGAHSIYHVAPTVLQIMGIKKPREMVHGLLH